MIIPITLAIFTALSWSTSGTIMKSVASRYGFMVAALSIALGNLALVGVAVLLIHSFSISLYSIELSLASGILLAIGYIFFNMSLQRQQASNTYATVEIQVIMLTLYGIFALGESIGAARALGMVVIVLGIFMVSYEKGHRVNKGLVPAMVANVFWALSWMLLVYPINHSGSAALPLWISFVSDIAIVLAVMLLMGKRPAHTKKLDAKGMSRGLLAGSFSGAGNVLYSIIIALKQLAVGAVMGNTSPAIVAVFAHFAYHDRLTRLQIAGLAAVVIGGVALGFY